MIDKGGEKRGGGTDLNARSGANLRRVTLNAPKKCSAFTQARGEKKNGLQAGRTREGEERKFQCKSTLIMKAKD